jgi:hexosaminidase
VPRKFYPRNASFEPDLDVEKQSINTLTIRLTKLEHVVTVEHGILLNDEACQLHISESGHAFITAATIRGAIYGLNNFAQLFYAHSKSIVDSYLSIAPVRIVDGPLFEHRGLNLDISRNWIAPKDVLRVLDAMAHCKFNKLHLHASDAQSWPLEVPRLPDLAREGAYDLSQIFEHRGFT